ncbi:FKBP-type peptidyl-prolyl cis-trans isomerase [Hymenobacter yonginensis]|uniref:Peptidyl-prolyl cis-trans isomerase n=1 Tax=Hymenobacter yonginensis TaxID=748197 RepID=A0ABY7PN69_9BACT|nr:FKBP-type peptidyl-prolyl cis-trans isomerase [Hymenobacter yonginensis]WBO84681.1 FKBP-type peptidyl-prolyl cis-trans isomerase [Hymenobacter yonginensis]
MKLGFKNSVLVRVAALVLAVAAPALSGCNKTDYAQQQEDRQNEYKVKDDALIQAYLTRKNITAGDGVNQYTRLSDAENNGLYLVKLSDGPATNPLITSGKQAEVKYVGRFLRETNESTIFDNSADNRTPCGCIPVTVGAGRVIKGWDQALLKMRKGDRKLLLVPSYLAYGQVGSGTIPGDEPLLFDMEILDVR